MKKLLFIGILLGMLTACSETETVVPHQEETMFVGMELNTLPYEGVDTRAIADEVKYVTVMLFDRATQLYNRQFSFDVVGTSYIFNMPVGNWTMVLVGTGDGLIADFATTPTVGVTLLTDVMLSLTQPTATTYSTTREYFYARQNIAVTSATTLIPAVTLVRIVGKMTVTATQALSDSLSYVKITLKNMVSSVNFMGTKSTAYVDQVMEQTGASASGIYSFGFYGFGSKTLGTTATDFNVNMGYIRKSSPLTLYNFQMDNAGDLQAGGLIVNTQTTITIGI